MDQRIPSDLPEEISNLIGMKLRLIPAGSFLMGSDSDDALDEEKPVHRVEITKPFYMGVYPVIQGQYKAVMGENPSKYKGSSRPVDTVSWVEAVAYCRKLSEMAGESYRLPTEAEWEYACRAGTTPEYFWGDEIDGAYCWYKDNSGGETRPVGKKKPNPWGLFNMLGNVDEWCSDWYDEDYYSLSPSRDPQGPASGELRVVRGGSCYNNPRYLRVSVRVGSRPGYRFSYPNYGFRCIWDLESLNP